MRETEVTNEPEVEETTIDIHENLVQKLMKRKDLVLMHDLAVESSGTMFIQELAIFFLRVAIRMQDERHVRDFILRGPDLNTQEGGELVWQALGVSDAKIASSIASMLVNAGASLEVRRPNDPRRPTLLHPMATMRSTSDEFYELALLMMDRGADVNAANEEGDTALHYAVTLPDKYSFVLAVELARRGARIEATNNHGENVIDIAMDNDAFDGQLCPMLIALADVDDDVKCRWILDAISAIVQTPRNRSVLGLRSLLELGFPILEMDGMFANVWMPLYFAVSGSKKQQLQVLLDYGLNVNMKFAMTTALHLALQRNHGEIANVLIARGADIRATIGASKEQPIYTACRSNSTENVRLLLRLGTHVNVIDSSGRTPYSMIDSSFLSDPLRECLVEQFAILTAKGIKINKKDWKNFRSHPGMLRYYNRSLGELKKMKTVKINHDISLFSLLTEDVEKISYFARNINFVRNFHENKQRMKALFPVYFKELEYIVKMAETRRDIVLSKEEALSDALNLPQLVITKIAEYASIDELIDFEKLYHVQEEVVN